ERIGAEMRKLLSAADPVEAVRLMEQAGVLAQVLPGAGSEGLAALCAVAPDGDAGPGRCPGPRDIFSKKKNWGLRLAAGGGHAPAGALRRWRGAARVQEELRSDLPLGEAAYRMGAERAGQLALLRASRGEALRADWHEQIAFAAQQALPISAADLSDRLSGPALGRGLKAAEAAWIEGGFLMPAPALVDIALLAGEGP
ncbi:MAG: CCA tRNA nucleotidyltransferase, partial [Paracoccus sp. (in: a-proteobacteria)]|nr:CCA tRNA nucleotidyltransferase [Paracoccus sp. (in: a-proteobacteria)]